MTDCCRFHSKRLQAKRPHNVSYIKFWRNTTKSSHLCGFLQVLDDHEKVSETSPDVLSGLQWPTGMLTTCGPWMGLNLSFGSDTNPNRRKSKKSDGGTIESIRSRINDFRSQLLLILMDEAVRGRSQRRKWNLIRSTQRDSVDCVICDKFSSLSTRALPIWSKCRSKLLK